ncbi:BatD family protein [Gemmatimonadota bacterium]
MTIQVQPTAVQLGGQFRLTVSVSGSMGSVPEAKIQGMKPFRIIGSSQSSQISVVNGQISAIKSVTYTVLAEREGTFELGPAILNLAGKSINSNTVSITIGGGGGGAGKAQPSQPSGQPPARPAPAPPPVAAPRQDTRSSSGDGSVFIRGTTDKKEVFLGEQLTYTFGFYSRVRMTENPEYTEPKFKGFWKEDVDKEANVSNRTVGGTLYRVQELRYALFPTVAGQADISAARLKYSVRNVWNFFDRGSAIDLAADPVAIKIKPLPAAGRPENFSGAVGDFKLSASLDKTDLKVGDALTLTVVVQGAGNVRTIDEPPLTGLDNFDIYESSSDVSVGFSGTTVRGRKMFKYVIVPRKAGKIDWPGLELSFFDPVAEKYRSASTGSLAFTVTPGSRQEAVTYRMGAESVVAVGEDIHYIKEDSRAALFPASGPWSAKPWFWLLHLLPAGAIGIALLYRRHRGLLMSDRGYARYRGSDKKAAAALKLADKGASAGDFTSAYAALNRAVTHFIGDRFNVEAMGMTTDEIVGLLESRGIGSDLREEIGGALDHFSFVRFAPVTGADMETYRDYRNRVSKLLDGLGRKI